MTISSTNRTAGPFYGNGVTTAFPFTFKVFSAVDLLLIKSDTATGVETIQTLGSDYTVAINADQNANPGGTITCLAAPATGNALVATSALGYLQPTDLTNGGGFYPNVITAALDRLTIFCQQLFSLSRRSLRLPLSDISMVAELPNSVLRANNLLGFDAGGNPIAVVPVSGSAAGVFVSLAQPGASSLVGGASQVVSSISALRGLLQTSASKSALVAGYYEAGDGGGGAYQHDPLDTTSADNGFSVIVATDGGRWKPSGVGVGLPCATAAQNLSSWQAALTLGGAYTFGPGLFPFASPITSSYAGAPSLGSHDTKRYDLNGLSRNNTVIYYSGTGYWLTAEGGASGHALQAFDRLSNFSLQSAAPGTNYGISYSLKVCPEISNIYIAGFKDGLRLDGVFSATVDNIKVAACENGLVLDGIAGLGSPNLIKVNKSNFEGCTSAGIRGNKVGNNILLDSVDVEGCGTTGNAATGGVILSLAASNGPGPLRVSNGYFELNKGGFDLYIENQQNFNAVAEVDGCFFNRASSTDHTISNIVLRNTGSGTLRVIVRNTAFFHTGTYVPSGAEPYFDIGAGCELIDGGGNSYSNLAPLPNNSTHRPGITSEIIVGDVNADATVNFVPNGVTVAKLGTGSYGLTHALGWGADVNSYFPAATSASAASNALVQRVVKTNPVTFTVSTTDVANTPVDCPFYFQVARNA